MVRRSKKTVAFSLNDWEGRRVIVPLSVVTTHLPRYHANAHEYIETFKERFSKPDKVLRRSKRDEVEVVIRLENRDHKYLIAYVKYKSVLARTIGLSNFVATIYPTNEEHSGEQIWPKKQQKLD